MKSIITAFIVLYIFLCPGRAQEGLLMKNVNSGKAWIYEKNARMTYIRSHEQEYKTAIINDLIDSTAVVLGKDTVPLKEIAGIRKRNRLHKVALVLGMPVMLIGSILMGQGIASMYSNPESGGGVPTFIIGAGIFSLGYVPYEMMQGEFNVSPEGKWTLQIYRAAPL